MVAIESLERQLRVATSNNTALQKQQAQLMESVHTLIDMVSTTTGTSRKTKRLSRNKILTLDIGLHYVMCFAFRVSTSEPDVEGLCRCLQSWSFQWSVSHLHR